MIALVTGASSGLGRDIAREFSARGYDLILVARRRERLEELAETLETNCEILVRDLSERQQCMALYEELKGRHIDVLVNNAGFGIFGDFADTDLQRELDLLSVDAAAVHILTKGFLKEFLQRDHGYILNVASIAGFMSGPQMAAYYAAKNYVVTLTTAIYEELRRKNSSVRISVLCPGPTRTAFFDVANMQFHLPHMSSEKVAAIAVHKLLQGKWMIIPGFFNRLQVFATRLLPRKLFLRLVSNVQYYKP